MHLDASLLAEENGTILTSWPDVSGNERGLDRIAEIHILSVIRGILRGKSFALMDFLNCFNF